MKIWKPQDFGDIITLFLFYKIKKEKLGAKVYYAGNTTAFTVHSIRQEGDAPQISLCAFAQTW